MLNTRRGKRFESVLKRKLKDNGFRVLKLSIPETADLVLLNSKPVLIECKVCNQALWYRKNNEQYDRLIEMHKEGYDVFIAIKFTSHKSIIKFFRLDDVYPYSVQQGMTLQEFGTYLKVENMVSKW